MSGVCCFAHLAWRSTEKTLVYGTSHEKVLHDNLSTWHLLLWVQLGFKKTKHPDIASFVCYALLHVSVFVGFSWVWNKTFAGHALSSTKKISWGLSVSSFSLLLDPKETKNEKKKCQIPLWWLFFLTMLIKSSIKKLPSNSVCLFQVSAAY